MPKVGKKEFPYTKRGEAAARRYAKNTGMKVTRNKKTTGGRKKAY